MLGGYLLTSAITARTTQTRWSGSHGVTGITCAVVVDSVDAVLEHLLGETVCISGRCVPGVLQIVARR